MSLFCVTVTHAENVNVHIAAHSLLYQESTNTGKTWGSSKLDVGIEGREGSPKPYCKHVTFNMCLLPLLFRTQQGLKIAVSYNPFYLLVSKACNTEKGLWILLYELSIF